MKLNKLPKDLPIQKKLVHKQEFHYSKGGVNLDFVLAIDKKELLPFIECLQEAVRDVQDVLINTSEGNK